MQQTMGQGLKQGTCQHRCPADASRLGRVVLPRPHFLAGKGLHATRAVHRIPVGAGRASGQVIRCEKVGGCFWLHALCAVLAQHVLCPRSPVLCSVTPVV